MAHFRGRDVVVLIEGVDVSGDGRSTSYEETADTLDDTVAGMDNRTKIASLKDGTFSYEALDTTGAWTGAWQGIANGLEAAVLIYPEGNVAGKREVGFDGVITSRSIEFPYDDLAKVSISGEISGPVSEGLKA